VTTGTQSFTLAALRNDNFAALSVAALSAHAELSTEFADRVATRHIEGAFRQAASRYAYGREGGSVVMAWMGILPCVLGCGSLAKAIYVFQDPPPLFSDASSYTIIAVALLAFTGWVWKQAYADSAMRSRINEALGKKGDIATLELDENFYGEADREIKTKIENLKTGKTQLKL
jgi:hypothetical protein